MLSTDYPGTGKVFDIQPFNTMGHVLGAAKKVGGLENLKKIINQMQRALLQ